MPATRTRKSSTDSKPKPSKRAAAKPAAKSPSAPRAKKSPPRAKAAPAAITHERIAQRAFEIWVERGMPIGCDEENWLTAEHELMKAA